MGYKRLALIALGRTMGINIIHVGKVRLKSMRIVLIGVFSVFEDIGDDILIFAEGHHFIHVEQFLAPFCKIWRINNNFRAEMTIALLI